MLSSDFHPSPHAHRVSQTYRVRHHHCNNSLGGRCGLCSSATMRPFPALETSWPTVPTCVRSTESSMHHRRHPRGCPGGLYLLAHPSVENVTIQQIHGGFCLQFQTTTHTHHRISPTRFQLQQPDNGLHVLRKPLRHPHADSSQLFVDLCHHPESETHHRPVEHSLRRHGRIDTHRLQLQFQLRIHVSVPKRRIAERQQPQKPPTQQPQ